MKLFREPKREDWPDLVRRADSGFESIKDPVREIFEEVEQYGDKALFDLTAKFDRVDISDLEVGTGEIESLASTVVEGLKDAITRAKENIEAFHRSQFATEEAVETEPGVVCWRRSVPIRTVGLYVPGGTAPLFSSLLMLAVPAKMAGCREIIVCTPPNEAGTIDPAIAFTASLCGVDRVFRVGGAQAIAAMALGTKTVTRCEKLFGPGNAYVTCAKQLASEKGIAIDMPAGPSEVAVLTDASSNPVFVASDLLAQAEHGSDSQAILVSNDERTLLETLEETSRQLASLPRRAVATEAIENSRALLFENLNTCLDFLNYYAAEHLILATENASELVDSITNAGSVFVGDYSCEAAGDYASGTNHTLPTNGAARSFSGVSIDSFVKKITFQKITPGGLETLGPTIMTMAAAEGLEAHRRSVEVRLSAIEKGRDGS